MLTSSHALEKKKIPLWGVIAGGEGFSRNNSKKLVVFLLDCYGCIFHGTGNSAQLCQNFGISGGRGEFEHPKNPPRYATAINIDASPS